MREFVRFLRKNSIVRWMTDVCFAFIAEYVCNHVIAHIPIVRLRWFFYRYVLRHDIDSSAYLYMNLYIYAVTKPIHIGKNTAINRKCILDGRGGLFIGDNVNISAEAAFYTGGHDYQSEDFAYYQKPVVIEDRVWIGTRAMIMPGVTIHEGAMVLPGAIVTKDVGAFEVVAGMPAKCIGKRNEDLSYELSYRGMFL